MKEWVLNAVDGPVASITLNRPERHNSLTPPFLAAILAALAEIPESARALLLRANGCSFSTGGDMKGFYERRADLAVYAEEIVGLLNAVMLAMIDLPLPIVTAVQGMVTGGSLGLILASDIVLVTPQASFTPYYGVVGFSPDGGWATWLPTVIGRGRTAEALLCNRTITAQEAADWGLAARVVAVEELEEAAWETAVRIAEMKRGSIVRSKRLLASDRETLAAGLAREKAQFVAQIETEEARQGIVDFLAPARAER